ncbi:MAG: right-handed parallel beta-helix repeat-containing protein [Actinomycetota bacterium]|nr:right-handed parallel beta-helix repeat-containing protein [Actinomycetota bacterium]
MDNTDRAVPATRLSRRRALNVLALGASASGAATACTDARGEALFQRLTHAHPPTEMYDVQRSGAICDGITDDTEAWAHAVATVAAAGGGLIFWRGVSVVNQISLTGKVGLRGVGPEASILKQKAGRAPGQHLIHLNKKDATYVSLLDFLVDGNRYTQHDVAAAIYLDNSDGSKSGIIARHLVRNVHVRNVAGSGLYWGYGMRASLVDGFSSYNCEEFGFHGRSCSDNTFQNMDLGRSGKHGVFLESCSNSKFSNIKSWYSGELQGASSGVYQLNGDTNIYMNISTQENAGSGMVMHGRSTTIVGVSVRGLVSDSDNTSWASSKALELNNVAYSMFDVAAVSKAPLRAKPYAGVTITRSFRNKIFACIDPSAATWELTGTSISDNSIDLSRGINKSQIHSDIVTVHVYQHSEHWLTLRGDKVIESPLTPDGEPPVGLTYRFIIVQDDVGGHTVKWSRPYKFSSMANFDTAPNTRTIVEFQCAGSDSWIMTSFITGIPG